MIFWANLIVQHAVIDRNEPAFTRPVGAGRTEVWLRTGLGLPGDDTDRLDVRIAEREHNVAGRHFSHVLVELVSGSVRIPFGRPHETPANFGPVRLVLVYPPIPHRGELASVLLTGLNATIRMRWPETSPLEPGPALGPWACPLKPSRKRKGPRPAISPGACGLISEVA